MPFSRLRKGVFCIIFNPRLNGKPRVVHLYWQLMACGVCNNDAVLWKREEKVGFDHKMLWFEGEN